MTGFGLSFSSVHQQIPLGLSTAVTRKQLFVHLERVISATFPLS